MTRQNQNFQTTGCSIDIPVFREVAGPDAMFFANELEPEVIMESVIQALRSTPSRESANSSWLTWEQSAQDLLACILE